MIAIYCKNKTPRITYTFEWIFEFILSQKIFFETNISAFKNFDGPKIAYSETPIPYSLSLGDSNLLYQDDIQNQDLINIEFEDLIGIIKSNHHSMIPFDIIASTFYLISRYEEYVPSILDQHQRFLYSQSVAFQQNFLDKTMVNRYINWIRSALNQQFGLQVTKPKTHFLLTMDVDHAFYNKNVPLAQFVKRNMLDLFNQSHKDKYDTYDFFIDAAKKQNIETLLFILCPENPHPLDHQNNRNAAVFQKLISYLKTRTKIGIHPSYDSIGNHKLNEETIWLQNTLLQKVTKNRFHFLRFQTPNLLKRIQNTTIQEDYSFGYAQIGGWRSSTSFPFPFFDLIKNKATPLWIYSPCWMDATYKYHQQNQEDFGLEVAKNQIKEIQKYGGVFIPIFHNDILYDENWQKAYLHILDYCKTD